MLLCIELLSSLQSRRILGRDPWIVFRNDVVPPTWTLILPESWDESKSVLVAFQDGGHDQGTSEFSLKNACSAGYCYKSNCFLNFPLFRIVFAWINEEFRIDSKVPSPFKPRFLKFMTGSFRLRIGIISVVGIISVAEIISMVGIISVAVQRLLVFPGRLNWHFGEFCNRRYYPLKKN